MKRVPSSWYLYGAAVLAVVALFVAIAVNGVRSRVPSEYDGFAQCLTEKGAKMYGTWWCAHCLDQKKLFGSAFDYVDYVECSPGGSKTISQDCVDAGVTKGVPAWSFADGTWLNGGQTLEALSEKTACSLSSADAASE